MSDIGDDFILLKEISKQKKADNYQRAITALDENGIKFKYLSYDHLRVHEWDYWPSTGLFIHTKTKKRGRGIRNLLKKIEEMK